ncbi:MAG TPA: D-alanyl-D-alanine carboxypeptidase/D-alanyl-D-alanine-endopeptidase [Casimicrobiaceae bacterium]|nr:D-alanyl-D-alanine carboxypeptidase/D-alanyl-D-alanine-endopeptidase [Casimicrobiaceae bacterium]
MRADTIRSARRALVVVAIFAAAAAHAALPRAVGRAFLDAGIPLNHVAIVVQDTAKPRPLFAYDANRPRSAASVMKLVTTFAALEMLGADYRWKTEAYLGGALVDGELHGDLLLKGYGDPKITVEQWQSFIAQLRAKGLDAVDGDLVLDRSRFALPPHDPGAFDHEPLKPYNVGPDALLVNFKSLKLTLAPDASGERAALQAEPLLDAVALGAPPALSADDCTDWRARIAPSIEDHGDRASIVFAGSYPASCGEREWWIAMLDHPHYVYAMFETYFRAVGGRFAGGLRERRVPDGAIPFAVLESPPLSDIVRDVNKLSNNVMARQIFLTLATTSSAPPATLAKANAAVKHWLAKRKLAMPGLVLDNGSGLSRRARNSAAGLNRLLIAANASAVREEFASSLAVAAVDGTVEHRFRNDAVAGQALLKTGSLEGVRALAGYVIDAAGHRYTVVAIVNDPNAARAAPALDFLVQWVYRNGAAWDPAVQRH